MKQEKAKEARSLAVVTDWHFFLSHISCLIQMLITGTTDYSKPHGLELFFMGNFTCSKILIPASLVVTSCTTMFNIIRTAFFSKTEFVQFL